MQEMIKVAICAVAKNENKYIKEWINYHLNLGFDKIFIYDNNDSCTEKISEIIQNESVEIYEWFDRKAIQSVAYTDCYNNHRSEFDWILYIDIDEFVVLEHVKNIKEFLSQEIFSNTNIIRLNWMHFTDNNELDVINNNYNVFNRFKERVKYFKDCYGKSFIHTKLDIKYTISSHGYCNKKDLKDAVNAIGEKCLNESCVVSYTPVYKNAWINHYRTKTIGEYIRQKYFRGDASQANSNRYNNLEFFFETNERTIEKEQYGIKLINELMETH